MVQVLGEFLTRFEQSENAFVMTNPQLAYLFRSLTSQKHFWGRNTLKEGREGGISVKEKTKKETQNQILFFVGCAAVMIDFFRLVLEILTI